MWLYALGIALSRVIVGAHYPTDVLLAALVGVTGAILVRNYFAMRSVTVTIPENGRITALT